MKAVLEFLKGAMSESGFPSSLRLVFVIFGLTFGPAVSIVWAYVSLYNRALSDIPSGVYDTLAVLLVGKAISKAAEVWGESKKPAP